MQAKKSKLSDLAGSWKMSDKEADEMMKTLKKGWNADKFFNKIQKSKMQELWDNEEDEV